ncbi:hypothetical protein NOS3756_27340 [Nostoc sp. NIES-3756]|uniref:hypothetical protein n=1 Tax=Nostoc sp. NIES-3756 TaxID=1751286 RepID=UPI0007226E0D|nr:hypothetical protein [Nostoc sp. NIES-3756]BAT53771.1 hypothetical protein NOS3756_27340 [Nostoc sp. NIES-3756]
MNEQPNNQPMVNLTSIAAQNLDKFVAYIKTIDPELLDYEALFLACRFLEALPDLCRANPNIVNTIQDGCRVIKQNRNNEN